MSTAKVIPLSSRRRRPEQTVSCPCRPDFECYSHRVVRAADLLRVHLAVTEGELLVDRNALESQAGSILALLDGVVSESIGPRRGAQ